MQHIDNFTGTLIIFLLLHSALVSYGSQGLTVYTGREAQYVNVWDSVHWEGVYSVGGATFLI